MQGSNALTRVFLFSFFKKSTFFVVYDNSYRQPEGRNRPNKQQTTANPFTKYFIRSEHIKAIIYNLSI